MMPREALAISRGSKIDEVFESLGASRVASRVRYKGPTNITDKVKRCMNSVDESVLARQNHNPSLASKDRIAAAIASAMAALIELSVREGIQVGKRIAEKS